VDRLLRLVDLAEQNGERFERGIQLACQAVLVSPHFLFRVELDPRGCGIGQREALRGECGDHGYPDPQGHHPRRMGPAHAGGARRAERLADVLDHDGGVFLGRTVDHLVVFSSAS
jgi:hypothetical protein